MKKERAANEPNWTKVFMSLSKLADVVVATTPTIEISLQDALQLAIARRKTNRATSRSGLRLLPHERDNASCHRTGLFLGYHETKFTIRVHFLTAAFRLQ